MPDSEHRTPAAEIGVPEDPGTVPHPGDDDIDDDDVEGDPEVGRLSARDDLLVDAERGPASTSITGDIGRGDRDIDRIASSGQADRGLLDLDPEPAAGAGELGDDDR